MTAAHRGTLRSPARIHFGYDARARLPEVLAELGSRVFALVDPFLRDTELVQATLGAIESSGLTTTVSVGIEPELPVTSLDELVEEARSFQPDVVLAIGGGSTLDAAKVVSLALTHPGPLSRFYGENEVPGPVLPVVAVPTTAGTGSEATPVAVVSDPLYELKVGISSPYLLPAAAVVDPEFTLAAPASVTAYAGIDALVHAIESYTAAALPVDDASPLPVFTGRNELSAAQSLSAMEKLSRWLPFAVSEPQNRRAREEVALGSLLAGISFGSTGTHLSHALQYSIGAATKTPHGLGTGLLLPYVVDACRRLGDIEDRLGAVGAALGSTGKTNTARANDAVTSLVRLNHTIGVPGSLAEIGLTAPDLPGLAELALSSTRLLAISPIPATRELLVELLEEAHEGRLSTRL
ncbi:MAG: iron-containing alcohol dehydrogenase [Pseudoclavibacter sp.]